ncbi:hypothetical protein Daus18300_014193 [Diaporthe australafricana]|uniref:Uncharacterized protein n=1 Tax=Diaporthe australafricana TaxID=127596 RepID=A0ABR3VW77_9PEZI
MGFVDVQYEDISMKLGAVNPKADLARRGVISTGIAAKGLAEFGKSLPPGKLSLRPEKLDNMSSDLEEELKSIGGLYPLRAVWARRHT